ncbi:rhomboid-related protein 2 [Aplysia californica]|uniref:Rhomboid-related protein 2 n=1 Tax=Aplysia californica TaxID=6500 RepID=A0ABM0JGB3_APLCA|nr:rhomboid-related protein 2 [Aplysia californica]
MAASRYEEEIELRTFRKDLDENFKPIFDKHEIEGVAVRDLRRELEEEGLLEHIPRRRMDQLLEQADRDADRHITYREFVHMMTHDLTAEERKPFRRMMRAAIADIIPRRQREDFLANYNCCPPPLFIPLISVAEIVIFIVYAIELKDRGTPVTATSGVAMYSPLVYKPTRRYEAWRFITYMFMHQGYMHILFNMIFQLMFGLSLEVVHKWWRVGLVYVLGALAGCLAHSVSDHNVGLVGASGGVYAILGAHVAAIIINWREMNYRCMDPDELDDDMCCGISRILLSAPVRLAIILILVVPDTALAIYRRVTEPDVFKVGVTAHIGGFLAGVFLGVVILRNINRLTWERTLGWVTLALFLAFFAFCTLFNALYDGYPETDWSSL